MIISRFLYFTKDVVTEYGRLPIFILIKNKDKLAKMPKIDGKK
jgi:hypothetical protein